MSIRDLWALCNMRHEILCMVVVAFTAFRCAGETSADPDPSLRTTSNSASTTTSARGVRSSRTEPGRETACAIDFLENGRDASPLPSEYCWPSSPAADELVCPSRQEVEVLVDHDSDTAAASEPHGERGRWRSLLTDLMNVSVGCRNGTEPLYQQLPGRCSTIQLEAQGRRTQCRNGSILFPTSVAEMGSTTPAAQAVKRVCDRLSRKEQGVALVAFDGVLDFESGSVTPRAAFVNEIRTCVQKSLNLTVVAAPSRYKYVYVFSRTPYTGFSENLARALASRWTESGVAAVVIPTTAHPEKRATAGNFRLERPRATGPHWDVQQPRVNTVSLGPDRGGSRAGYEVDVAGWAVQGDDRGAEFSVRWESDAFLRAGVSAGALQFPRPTVFANQPASDYFGVRDTALHTLPACAERIKIQRQDGCGQPTAQFFQSISLSQSALNVRVLKNDLEWASNALPVRKILSSAAAPLFSAAVVSPAARIDPCIEQLRIGTAGADRWGPLVSTPQRLSSARKACSGSLLQPLVESMMPTPFARFVTAGGSFVDASDRRAGLMTVVESLRAVAEVQVENSAMRPCVLGTFRLITRNCRPVPSRVLPARTSGKTP